MSYRSYRGAAGSDAIWIIIFVNLLLFVISIFYSRLIYIFGLQGGPINLLLRPWALVTSLFLHADIWHIFFNMLALFFFGRFLTQLVGERRFLWVYFLGGIAGNILFALLAPPFTRAIGASGAIYALGGTLAVMRPKVRVFVFGIIPMPLWMAITGFFLLSFFPMIAWEAHLGGLLTGLLSGYLLRRRERSFF
jgi:membrane associated rhomboid family serine protease